MSWPYANTELWDDLADKEISFKAIFLFRVITCNPLMSHSGLYKVSIAQLSLWTAMPRPEVASAIEELKNAMLIWYDNKVLFSPYIPEEQRYQSQDNLTRGRKRWRDIIQKARRMCIDTPSETGEENSAFAAFEQFHAELLFEIESLEEEKLQRNVKKAIAEETDTSRTLPPETGNPPPNIENPSRSVHESLPQNGGTLRNKEKEIGIMNLILWYLLGVRGKIFRSRKFPVKF